jgi:hypothetical protein
MHRFRLPLILPALAVAALLLAVSAPAAWAHPRLPAVTLDDVPEATAPVVAAPGAAVVPSAGAPVMKVAPVVTAPGVSVWPLLAVVSVLALGLLAPRRVLATALILVFAVLAVETGVHSVHHLSDQQAASQCVVAVAAANVQGMAEPIATAAPEVLTRVGTVVVSEFERPGARPLRPDEGRAPPSA